jgi:hypothetical protein
VSKLYRMRIENTQFADLATGWSLAWPKDGPPEVKPLPRTITTALQNRLDAGAIVGVEEDELTGEEIVIEDTGPAPAPTVPNAAAGDGRPRSEHQASFKVYDAKGETAKTRRIRDQGRGKRGAAQEPEQPPAAQP